MKTFAEIAFTPAVQTLQSAHGSRAAYARMQNNSPSVEGLGRLEADFLSNVDSFFIATVSETGWPYVQHRGGPSGFLKVISPERVAFADFAGNRQYVSAGNVSQVDRAAIIAVDYAAQRRLKLLGHLRFEDLGSADPELVLAVELPGYRARVERIAVIEVEAFDWNCPQHIPQRKDKVRGGLAGGEPPYP
ncbi:MAG TPA: pyridoxamine 5'-phosphate oxidase family protein [Burkholderiales bacterium]|nr:pyridoxamine 5'-phosphate oxidase family protein [Burkholderiales bacterium]